MKFGREVIAWFIVGIVAAAACLIFGVFVQPEHADFSSARPGLFNTAPAFFATIAFSAFFLLIRFFIRGKRAPGHTKLQHVGFALLLSLSLLASWELVQLLLTDQIRYLTASLLGGFAACLLVVLLWLFIRARVRETNEKKNDSFPSSGA